jgi:hypothetical protein
LFRASPLVFTSGMSQGSHPAPERIDQFYCKRYSLIF